MTPSQKSKPAAGEARDSKLGGLARRIESLRSAQGQAGLADRYQEHLRSVRAAAEAIATAAAQVRHARACFANAAFHGAESNLERAGVAAAALRALVTRSLADITTATAREKVVGLTDAGRAAQREVSNRWRELIREKEVDYRPLAEALRKGQIDGASDLELTLNRLTSRTDRPPASDRECREVVGNLRELELAVSKLGLDAESRTFLVSAAKGMARADELLKPAIKKTADRYKLWGVLKVRLG